MAWLSNGLLMKFLKFMAVALVGIHLTVGTARAGVQWEEITLDNPEEDLLELAGGLKYPWSFAFLPDASILITERLGDLKIILPAEPPRVINGLPPVSNEGHGGILDVALDPNFHENRTLYLSFPSIQSKTRGPTARHLIRGDKV